MVIRPFLHLSFTTSIRQIGSRQMNSDPYASSSFIGHSLWVCPTGPSKEAYSDIIKETSADLDTFCFTPHITLVAAIMTSPEDVVERTRTLAAKLAPYTFEFETVSQKDRYFQCVFAKMKRTPEVGEANQVAREVFQRQSDPEYMPHLSLVYGDFSSDKKEQQIIPRLSARIQEAAPDTTTFTVDSIEVWSTQGEASEWYLVETVPLTGEN